MDNSFETLLEHSKQAIRYWWLLLLTGIALFIIGLVVFLYPAQSYLGMSLMFGFLIFFSGLFQIILSAGNKHYMTGRGWMLAGGIIEVILGVILILNTALSAATLPIFLAFWLLFRSFSAIGLGSDMNAMNVPGSGWTIVSGVLLLLLSMWILFQPILFGTAAVIIWVGISLLFAGMSACIFAFQLRDVHKHMKSNIRYCSLQIPAPAGIFRFARRPSRKTSLLRYNRPSVRERSDAQNPESSSIRFFNGKIRIFF